MTFNIRNVIKNDYALSIAAKVVSFIFGFISSAFATRFLGVQYKGDYSYITSTASIIVLILNMGIYQSYSVNYKKYGKSILPKYLNIIFLQFFILFFAMIVMVCLTKDLILSLIAVLVPFNILKLQYGNIVLIEKIKLSIIMSMVNSVLNAIVYLFLYLFASPSLVYIVGFTVFIDI